MDDTRDSEKRGGNIAGWWQHEKYNSQPVIVIETGHDGSVVRKPHSPSKRNRADSHAHESTGLFSREPPEALNLCVVCGEHPQYSKGRKQYPTCGLRCAAELESRGGGSSKPMCVICGIRPRHLPYPTCGLTCAAKLESMDASPENDSRGGSLDSHSGHQQQGADLIPSSTYSACLMCWKVPQQADSEFCDHTCSSAAEKLATLLLEAPQGHVTFQRVSEHFHNTWKTSAPCPEVLTVYKIVEHHSDVEGFDKYRNKVCARTNAQDKESRRWYGTKRECDLGDRDDEDLCSSPTCLLCSTIRHSFDLPKCHEGIHTSSTSDQSDRYSEGTRTSPRKVMLLTDVSSGKEVKLSEEEALREKPFDYDSVRIVNLSGNRKVSPPDDLIVYTKDAIKPLYLVVYDR